jgi:glycosyltransferase involved in cell wall biosynthesis
MEQARATLSLCIIAKNESEHIGRCLQSARDWVDEIIVVDTGSTDDTGEIARALGATVIEAEWQDDFSRARNVSLENATGDWILFLDCDEELAPESGPKLRALLQDGRYEAYFIQVANLTESGRLLAPSVRLFRNRTIFRFEGRIHEQIATSILANYGQQSIGQCGVSIIHYGYNGTQANIQAKIRRNLRLLGSVDDARKDGFYYYNLGVEHLRLREKEKALGCFLEAAKMTATNLGFAPILALRTATTLMELSKYLDAVRHLRYYQLLYGDFRDLVFLEGLCYLHCGWYSKAAECLQKYFAMPPAPSWYPTETNFCGAPPEEYRDWLQGRAIPRDFPEISACIIGRNEADHIRHCIHSVNEIAREVIYVDTGSTDDTPAIAGQHGARVFTVPWPGSFSEARNFSLDQAASEWILVLDADEMLPEEGQRQIAELTREAPPDVAGYILKICTVLSVPPPGSRGAGAHQASPPADCHLTGSCRLFRRNGARYQGAAGEDVVASLLSSGQTVTPAEIAVNHLHFQSEPGYVARKRQWKLDTINQGLPEDPVRRDYLTGVEHFYARDFAAAAGLFEACRNQCDMTGTPGFFFYHALSLINTGEHRRAAGVLEEALAVFPDYTDLTYLQAIAECALGNMDAAEALLRRCLAMGDSPWQKYLANPGTGSFKAMHSLGTILAHQGQADEALDLFFEVAGLPGGLEQAIEGIVVLSDRLNIPPEQVLEERSLLSPESLSAASRTYAGMLRFKDSLRCLDLACDQVARSNAPRNFTGVIQAIEQLIKRFCRGDQT